MPFTAGPDGAWESDDHTPVYVISVAAELTGLHAQTLRQYDRLGLVSPGRTRGGGRRYSRRDIERLREVVRLSSLGMGLEGVRMVLELEDQVSALRFRLGELQSELDAVRAERAQRPRTALVVWCPDRQTGRWPWTAQH
jgi:MerR family transcriptional regulator/heat shock protein HspR